MNVTLSSVDMPDFSRRNFLKLAGQTLLVASSFLGLGAIFRFLGFQTEPSSPTTFDLGPAADFPLGSRTHLPEIPAILLHTEDGFSAISLVCTHLGCTVQQEGVDLFCPCHGSRYGMDGTVLHGPAEKRLASLRVELATNGHIILHKNG
jgi:cytochrome b6-f complex iron-sulfur subunit